MAKKCISCGAELADDVMFCDKCGAGQNAESTNMLDSMAAKIGVSKTVLLAGAGAIVAVVLVVMAVAAATVLGSGYKKPIENAEKAIKAEKADKFVKSYPEELAEALDDYYDNISGKDFAEVVEDSIENRIDYYEDEFGKDCKVSYKVIDTIKLNEDELDDVSKWIEKATDEDITVKKGYKVVYKVTVDGKKEKYETFSTCMVVKAFGKWVFYTGAPFGGNAADLPEIDD